MADSIIDAVSMALNGEFGDDYEIYGEEIEQGLREPAFLLPLSAHLSGLIRGTDILSAMSCAFSIFHSRMLRTGNVLKRRTGWNSALNAFRLVMVL